MHIFQYELKFIFVSERPQDTEYNVSKYVALYTKQHNYKFCICQYHSTYKSIVLRIN